MSAEKEFEEIRDLMRRSEYLSAFHRAQTAVAEHQEHVGLKHRGVLCLARLGCTEMAGSMFEKWGLDNVTDNEDVLSLRGRILKESAETLPQALRVEPLKQAIKAYEQAFDVSLGFFPAINVATLNLMLGDTEEMHRWANAARSIAERGETYYSFMTVAEAALMIGDEATAHDAMTSALRCADADPEACATTRRQMKRILERMDLRPDVLDVLRQSNILCYRSEDNDPASAQHVLAQEKQIASELKSRLVRDQIGVAFGSLCAGLDILIAEAILETGGSLEVILPFDRRRFIDVAVWPAGGYWIGRFQNCLERATQIHYVSDADFLDEERLQQDASYLSAGLAALKARQWESDLYQIRQVATEPRSTGHAPDPGTEGLALTGKSFFRSGPATAAPHAIFRKVLAEDPPLAPRQSGRSPILFGDVKGFSKLRDKQMPDFIAQFLGCWARVLAPFESETALVNTWGDGLFLVMTDLLAAARCAVDLRDRSNEIERTSVGLPEDLVLRLGMHFGPIYEAVDPVTGRGNAFGSSVTTAARVEPITLPGEIFITEHTAAALALEADADIHVRFAGTIELAKGYGDARMYVLRSA